MFLKYLASDTATATATALREAVQLSQARNEYSNNDSVPNMMNEALKADASPAAVSPSSAEANLSIMQALQTSPTEACLLP